MQARGSSRERYRRVREGETVVTPSSDIPDKIIDTGGGGVLLWIWIT